MAENKEHVVESAFFRTRFDNHLVLGIFKDDTFSRLGLFKIVKLVEAAKGYVVGSFVLDGFPTEGALRLG